MKCHNVGAECQRFACSLRLVGVELAIAQWEAEFLYNCGACREAEDNLVTCRRCGGSGTLVISEAPEKPHQLAVCQASTPIT